MTLALLPVLGHAQDNQKYTFIRPEPKVGLTYKWKFDVNFAVMGNDAKFTGSLVRKIIKLDPNGDQTWESQMTDAKLSFGGNESDQNSPATTTVIDKDGNPKEEKESSSDLEDTLGAYATFKSPVEGILIGQEFEVPKTKMHRGVGHAKLIGFDTWKERKCAKFSLEYAPDQSQGKSSGTVYLDKETGILVGFDFTFKAIEVFSGVVSDGDAHCNTMPSGTNVLGKLVN